jgi:hypothetical protein
VTKYLASLPPALLLSRLIFSRRSSRTILTAPLESADTDNPVLTDYTRGVLAIFKSQRLTTPNKVLRVERDLQSRRKISSGGTKGRNKVSLELYKRACNHVRPKQPSTIRGDVCLCPATGQKQIARLCLPEREREFILS